MLEYARKVFVIPQRFEKNDEGTVIEGFDLASKRAVLVSLHPITSKLTYEIFGARVESMLLALTEDKTITYGDGFQINSNVVNYQVVSLKAFTHHNELTLEKIDV